MNKQYFVLLGLTPFVCPVQSATILDVQDVDITKLLNPLSTTNAAGPPNQYSFIEQTHIEQQGKKWVRHQQRYLGIPIYGQSVVSLKDHYGVAQAITGNVVQDIENDIGSTLPLINQNQAINIAKAANKSSIKRTTTSVHTDAESAELMIIINNQKMAQLIYHVSYLTVKDKAPSRPITIIDAKDGRILDRWEGITFKQAEGVGGNQKSGRYYFNDNSKFGGFEVNNACQMDSKNVVTLDMNSSTWSGRIHQFTCPENTARSTNGAYAPMNDAQYFGQQVFDMYDEWLNTRPIRQKLTMRVHYGNNYGNAFWDGQQMTFGDGGSYMYPLATWDVIAHEVSHGFTEQNSNLEYRGMSGGMNESFSDVSAAALSYFVHGSFNWKMGEHVMKHSEAMRFFIKPSQDGASIQHVSQYYNGIDVHHSSGIFNHAFYLLATSPDWNIKKAFLVYATANKLFWQPRSTFQQGAEGICQAAIQLGYETQSITTAFQQVGITVQHCESSTPNPQPPRPNPETPTPSNEATLVLNQPTVIKGVYGDKPRFRLNNPPSNGYVSIDTYGGQGDIDIFIATDRQPTPTDYDCSSQNSDTYESCLFLDHPANSYHVLVVSKSDFSDVSLLIGGNSKPTPPLPTPPIPQPDDYCAYMPEWSPYTHYDYQEVVQSNGYMFLSLQPSSGWNPYFYPTVWQYLRPC